jgi:LPS-assembly lipoprotein
MRALLPPLLLLLLMSMSSCGFSLRGTDVLASSFGALQLELEQPNSEFSRLLQRSLEVANIDTSADSVNDNDDDSSAGSATPEAPRLFVSAERAISRPVSINPRARAAQHEVRLAVDISLQQGNKVLLAPETLVVERSYFEDIENIAGNQEEIQIITTEMRRDLVNQLLRRLEANAR